MLRGLLRAVPGVLHTQITPWRLSSAQTQGSVSDTAWLSHFERNPVRFLVTASNSSLVYLSEVSAVPERNRPTGPRVSFPAQKRTHIRISYHANSYFLSTFVSLTASIENLIEQLPCTVTCISFVVYKSVPCSVLCPLAVMGEEGDVEHSAPSELWVFCMKRKEQTEMSYENWKYRNIKFKIAEVFTWLCNLEWKFKN